MLQGPRVGIFFGGIDDERMVSIKSAETVKKYLDNTRYRIKMVEILDTGNFLLDGDPSTIEEVSKKIDVAFLAVHGAFGEDGQLQKMLESYGVNYTGSDAISSAVAFSKSLTRDVLSGQGIKVAAGQIIKWSDIENRTPRSLAQELFQTFPQPCVVKPDRGGSSFGISVCSDINGLSVALEKAFSISDTVLVEEFIEGEEATVGVVEHMRDQDIYALPGVEIVPEEDRQYFDYEAKYEGKSREVCPAGFGTDTCKKIEELAIKCHQTLQLSDYSRTDFRIHPKRGIFVLEINTLPGLTDESLLPKELAAVGISLHDFFDHVIRLNLPFDVE